MACTCRCESLGVTLAYLEGKTLGPEKRRDMRTAAVFRCTHKLRQHAGDSRLTSWDFPFS